jgi:hypothetical protein
MPPVIPRKIGLLLLIPMVWVSLTLPSSAQREKWVRVVTDSSDRSWFVDKGSITGRKPYLYFWSYVFTETPRTFEGQSYYSAAYYLSVDCQKQLFRLRFVRLYDKDFKLIRDYDYADSLEPSAPPPSSGEAASMNFVCLQR